MEENITQLEKEKILAIENFLLALDKLRELKIINNKKDFTSQLGEWLIAEMYGATLATSGKEKDWDMSLGEKKIQVKSHSKAKSTPRSNTDFRYKENASIDTFIIVVFTVNYKIKTIYEIPWKIALELKTQNTLDPVITWSKIPPEYKVDLDIKIGDNKLLRSFLEAAK